MKLTYNKGFVASGLIMILMGLLAPLAHKHVAAPFGLLQAHLIGEVQALLFFCLAFIWPTLNLPRLALSIGAASLQIGLWTNMIGTLLIGILGAGKEQYIVNGDKIPGYHGLWNEVTNLMINLSAYAVIPIILALWGVLRRSQPAETCRKANITAVLLFLALGAVAILQTAFPEYSNF
jgi:hydroxylaminobenzene mutase